MEKIVIGGGQCSGKTTILNELRKEFCCVNEATSYLIDNGFIPEEHSFEEFQNKVIEKQKELESFACEKIVFLDRCLIDTILYLEEENQEIPKKLIEDIKNANYTHIFFLEMLPEKYWGVPAHKKPRVTTYKKGKERTKKLLKIYQRFDIPINQIPVAPLEKRIILIKETMDKFE